MQNQHSQQEMLYVIKKLEADKSLYIFLIQKRQLEKNSPKFEKTIMIKNFQE